MCLQEQGPGLIHHPPFECLAYSPYAVNLNEKDKHTILTYLLVCDRTAVLSGPSTGFQEVLGSMFAPRYRYRITGISLSVLKQIDPSEQKTLANLPWIVEPGQEAKRGINTKYETTIF